MLPTKALPLNLKRSRQSPSTARSLKGPTNFSTPNPSSSRSMIERVEVIPLRKVAPPETTAGIFCLKNRRKDEWRDKVETGIANNDGEDVEPVRFYLPSNGRDKIT